MTVVSPPVFKATDIALSWSEAVQVVRTSGAAVIVDTDGSHFEMTPVGAASREQYVLKGLQDALRILRLAGLPDDARDPVIYGEFAWLAILPADRQIEFAWSYVRALEAIPDDGVGLVEDLIYDWQQTARAYADRRLRKSLSADVDEPLVDVEL
jgi:hypothetical protein